MSLDLAFDDGDRHQVTDGVDHAPALRAVLLDDDVTDPLQTQRAQRLALVLLAADGRLLLLDLERRHHSQAPAGAVMPSARARSSAAGATSSTARPRRAATAS